MARWTLATSLFLAALMLGPIAWTAGEGPVAYPSYTQATLPSPGIAGRLVRVTDDNARNVRGLYVDTGSAWVPITGGWINARELGATGNCHDDQTTALTNWINAVKAVAVQGTVQGGYLPRGCYRNTAALPMINVHGVRIKGDGVQSVLFNANAGGAADALTVTGQYFQLEDVAIEGVAGSRHGIHLKGANFFLLRNVVVASNGGTGAAYHIQDTLQGTCFGCRTGCNVPGCQQYTTDITGNGGRGTALYGIRFSGSVDDISFYDFRDTGRHTDDGVRVDATSATGINFFGGVFEAAPAGKYQIRWDGETVRNSVMVSPYISCSSGLGLLINDAYAIHISGGQSNCATTIKGNARSNLFTGFETTGNVDILADGGDIPRMNTFVAGRITGTITDNGSNTTFLAVADNGSQPINNKLAGHFAWGGGSSIDRPLTATASLNYSALKAHTCEDVTMTVTNAGVNDTVKLGLPDALAAVAGTTFHAWVSAANTVTVRRCNIGTAATPDPAPATVRAFVFKFN